MTKKIITVPEPILRAESTNIALPSDQRLAQRFAQDLKHTLVPNDGSIGVGLALPQIGKNSRVFVTFLPNSSNVDNTNYPSDAEYKKCNMRTFFNPILIDHSDTLTLGPDADDPILEGCLSIPGIYGSVPRYEWVTLQYINEFFEEKTDTFSGFFARVIQHEYDHLNGILFTDHVLKAGLPLFQRGDRDRLVEIDPNIAKTW